jgi:hypothetical protein
LPSADAARLWQALERSGLQVPSDVSAEHYLRALRAGYEPYVGALAEYLLMDLPRWVAEPGSRDDWEVTAWGTLSRTELAGD